MLTTTPPSPDAARPAHRLLPIAIAAAVMAGGTLPHPSTVTEQELLDLEREAFLSDPSILDLVIG